MWWVVVSCIAIIVAVTHASVTGGGFMGAACTVIWIHTGCGLASATEKKKQSENQLKLLKNIFQKRVLNVLKDCEMFLSN